MKRLFFVRYGIEWNRAHGRCMTSHRKTSQRSIVLPARRQTRSRNSSSASLHTHTSCRSACPAPVPHSGTTCSTLHTCAVPSKHLLSANARGRDDTNSRQQNTEQEVKDMNRHSLLAVALIAMVCTGTGLGAASVPEWADSQFPRRQRHESTIHHRYSERQNTKADMGIRI